MTEFGDALPSFVLPHGLSSSWCAFVLLAVMVKRKLVLIRMLCGMFLFSHRRQCGSQTNQQTESAARWRSSRASCGATSTLPERTSRYDRLHLEFTLVHEKVQTGLVGFFICVLVRFVTLSLFACGARYCRASFRYVRDASYLRIWCRRQSCTFW